MLSKIKQPVSNMAGYMRANEQTNSNGLTAQLIKAALAVQLLLLTQPAAAADWGARFRAWTQIFNDGTAMLIAFGAFFGIGVIIFGFALVYKAKRHQEGSLGGGVLAIFIGSALTVISGVSAVNNETLIGAVS